MADDDLLTKYGLTDTAPTAPVKAVTQGDELLSKYGIVDDEPYQGANLGPLQGVTNNLDNWWKGVRDNSSEGIAKRFGIGMVRGAKDVVDTLAHGVGNAASYVADKTLPESIASKIRDSVEATKLSDLAARKEFEKEYPSDGITATDVGRIAGQIGATAPLIPEATMSGIAGITKALPTINRFGQQVAAPLANRLVSAAGQGGVGGALFNATTASTNDKSLAENIGEGAVTGAVGGPIITTAGAGAKKLASMVAGRISPERAMLARLAAKHGIDLDASQVSTSPMFKKASQMSGMLPLTGSAARADKQVGQFTRAVSRTFGEDTDNITPQVIDAAKKRLGNDYETVAAHTNIPATQNLANNIAKISNEAREVLDDNQFNKFQKQVDLIINKFSQGQGTMDGKAWQAFRHINSPMGKLINSKDTDLGYYVKGLRVAMDDAFNKAAPSDMQSLLQKTNQQYKAMKTVDKLTQADAEGHVSPLKLMSKVVNSPGGKLKSGELGELADIGRAFFPQPADSGTPLGEMALHGVRHIVTSPLTGTGALAGALIAGSAIPHAIEGAVGLSANALLRKAANSAAVRDSIINAAQGATHGPVDRTLNRVVPWAAAIPYRGPNLGPLQPNQQSAQQ